MVTGQAGRMHGYTDSTYGDAFADVYDDLYDNVSDVAATLEVLIPLASAHAPLPVVELGVGTGRLAIPFAQRLGGQLLIGIDSSDKMLQRLVDKDPADLVEVVRGDMVADIPAGPLALVFVAYNTFFNLRSAELQQRCFAIIAERLTAGGHFAIEAFVPNDETDVGDTIELRSLSADEVVLAISRVDASGVVDGQFVQFSESGGVRLRPWSILPASPETLDGYAAHVGLTLAWRAEDFAGAPFSETSRRHVSVYRKR